MYMKKLETYYNKSHVQAHSQNGFGCRTPQNGHFGPKYRYQTFNLKNKQIKMKVKEEYLKTKHNFFNGHEYRKQNYSL